MGLCLCNDMCNSFFQNPGKASKCALVGAQLVVGWPVGYSATGFRSISVFLGEGVHVRFFSSLEC